MSIKLSDDVFSLIVHCGQSSIGSFIKLPDSEGRSVRSSSNLNEFFGGAWRGWGFFEKGGGLIGLAFGG